MCVCVCAGVCEARLINNHVCISSGVYVTTTQLLCFLLKLSVVSQCGSHGLFHVLIAK